MILFQKICKTLFVLWGVFFCFSIFSNPFLFSPMLLSPFFLPSRVTLPQNTPLQTLCPPSMPVQFCLLSTSFPLIQTPPNAGPDAKMFTPFSHNSQKISSERRRKLFSKRKWKSYQYSDEDNKLKGISDTERNIEPEEDYYRLHIQENPENNGLTQVIRESKVDDQQENDIGELRGVETAKILNEIEKPSTNSSSPQAVSPKLKETKEETQEETKEEKQEEKQEETQALASPIVLSTSVTTIALNYNNISEQCSDMESGNTEAVSICTDCSHTTNIQLQRDSERVLGFLKLKVGDRMLNTTSSSYFNTKLENRKKSTICHGKNALQSVQKQFDEECGNISFDNYVREVLICESCKNKIPPALMLSMMSLESDGVCSASGDDGQSHGLFQINTQYHKDPPVCSPKQKEQVQTAELAELKNESNLQCLDNPIANTKKSIKILNKIYQRVNQSDSHFDCRSTSVNAHQVNQWRKALASYNGGSSHINRLKNMEKPENIPEAQWGNMDEWEKIRVQYFFDEKLNPELRMGNLAHVETALGSTGHSKSELNLFNSWNTALGNNIDLSQCQ